jgi:hypothetical protein
MTIYEDLFWMSVLLIGEINLEKTTTLPLIVDKTLQDLESNSQL